MEFSDYLCCRAKGILSNYWCVGFVSLIDGEASVVVVNDLFSELPNELLWQIILGKELLGESLWVRVWVNGNDVLLVSNCDLHVQIVTSILSASVRASTVQSESILVVVLSKGARSNFKVSDDHARIALHHVRVVSKRSELARVEVVELFFQSVA